MLFLENYFLQKITRSRKSHPVYIIPTSDGIKVALLNVLLLIIGLVYANNYVLLFNFMLFCLFMSSMFYTHFNLHRLKLNHLSPSHAYQDEPFEIKFFFSSEEKQGHHFLNLDLKNQNFKQIENCPFAVTRESHKVQLLFKAAKRGKYEINNLYVETRFPFNFFRCFTFFSTDMNLYVYPSPKNLNMHKEELVFEAGVNDPDDYTHKNFAPGDSPKRINWKKFAQTSKLLSKHHNHISQHPVMLEISSMRDIERQLQSVCFAAHKYFSEQTKFGLKIDDQILLHPDCSLGHFQHCLEILAVYEA